MKRPHLERKLAYLKSMHVELAVRLQVQQEAESVAGGALPRCCNASASCLLLVARRITPAGDLGPEARFSAM